MQPVVGGEGKGGEDETILGGLLWSPKTQSPLLGRGLTLSTGDGYNTSCWSFCFHKCENAFCSNTYAALLFFLSSVGRVYKRYYNSLLENSFLANLAGFAALTIYLEYVGAEQALAVYIMIGLSFAAFVLIITIQLYMLLLKLLREKNDQTLVNGYANLNCQVSVEDRRD